MLLMLSTAASAQAPYTVDFNTAINTSSHDFVVAEKWKHIVDVNTYYDNNMSYRYEAKAGINGSGALQAYKQKYYDYGEEWDGTVTYDLLVTPIVSGTVTIYAKPSGSVSYTNKAFLELWSLNGDVRVEKLASKEWSSTGEGFSAVTVQVNEPQRIGIRAQYVLMDDFSATAIDDTPEAALQVVAVMNANGQTGTTGTNPKFEQRADGKMVVALKVQLKNIGDVDLVRGITPNYTLTPAWATYSGGAKSYYEEATSDVPGDLAKGEEKTFDMEFVVPYTYGTNGYVDWFVRENISGSTSTSYRYAQTVAYESKFVFRTAGGTATASLSDAQDFGLVNEETTKHFEIYNDGAAPLTLKSITLPAGFTSANLPAIPAEGLTVGKYAKQALDITLPTTTSGEASGDLVIVYLDKSGNEKTYTLAFRGKMLDAGKWMASFDSDNWTDATWPEGSVHLTNVKAEYKYVSAANYNYWLTTGGKSSGYQDNNWFITPKLHAAAGEKFSFDVAYREASGSYYVKVYLSTDRKTWGNPVRIIANSELKADFQTFQIEAPAEGDYYVGFEIWYVKVDNLFGFSKVQGIDHDIYFVKAMLPAEVQSGEKFNATMEVIPVKAEKAKAYTVSYYVDGEAVATAESTDLAPGSSTTFALTYTPTVASTTQFTTYIAMKLTDGTLLAKSDEQTLTVTNEPKFAFVTASTTISKYTTSTTTPQNFGKVNTPTEKLSFKIANIGSAVLKVKSITAPAGFTVSATGPLQIAAGETQAIDVTFSATATGSYCGNLVIVYEKNSAGDEETYVLAFSGTMLDAAKFYATFGSDTNLNNLPAGSLIQTNVLLVTPTTDNAALTSPAEEKNLFITPLLTADKPETVEFCVRARSTSYEALVKVYAVKDHLAAANAETEEDLLALNPTLLKTVNRDETSYGTYSCQVPAGDCYLAFWIEDAYVDDIYGMTVKPVAHEWQLVSTAIPTQAMQNVVSQVGVSLRNIGQHDEQPDDYTVTAYVDGEAVVTAKGSVLPMCHRLTDAGTLVTAPLRYPKTGTFPVYIEVKAGDYVVTTETVDVTFSEEEMKSDIAMKTGNPTSTGLLHMNWNNSETVNLYSKTLLAELGLNAGDRITSITFRGYNVGTKNYATQLSVWYEFTDDVTQAQPASGKYDTSAMTQLLSTQRSWATAEGNSDNPVDLITLTFDEPLVYNGQSLRIVVASEGKNYQNGTQFLQSTVGGNGTSYQIRHDNEASFATMGWSANSYLPAIFISIATEPVVFSGTVTTGDDAPLAHAEVTLVSTDGDNVQYHGTTDADGHFAIKVVQAYRQYEATASAKDHLAATVTIGFNGKSLTHDFVLSAGGEVTGIGDAHPTRPEGSKAVYDLRGRRVAETVANTLKPGLYIIDGKKVVVRK